MQHNDFTTRPADARVLAALLSGGFALFLSTGCDASHADGAQAVGGQAGDGPVDGAVESQEPVPGASPELVALAETAAAIQIDVEELRGLDFKADVPVEVADRESFARYAAERMESVGDQRTRDAQELIAKLLGLIPAEMDYWGDTLDILGGQVGGYYDPDRDTFSIMEGVGGALAKSILAHELVHALDDQHFDLGGGLSSRSENSDHLAAYHSVVEGSAMLIQNRWTIERFGQFSAEDLEEMSDITPDELFEAPAYIWMPVLFSYFRGQCFLIGTESLMEVQTKPYDIERINRAFEAPPLSTEQILHPDKYWNPEAIDEPVAVAVAVAGDAWTPVRAEVMGELGLFLVTAGETITAPDMANPLSFLSLTFTSAAAEGWAGDAAQLFERGDDRLLALVSRWDSSADRDQFAAAVEAQRETFESAAADLAALSGLEAHGIRSIAVGEREHRLLVGLGLGGEALDELVLEVSATD